MHIKSPRSGAGRVAGGKREARNPRDELVTSSLHPARGNATRFLKCRGQAEVERESVVPSNGRGVRADKENVTLPLTIGASGVGRHCSRLWDPDDDTTHENEASRERMPIDIKDGGCPPRQRRLVKGSVTFSLSALPPLPSEGTMRVRRALSFPRSQKTLWHCPGGVQENSQRLSE